MPAGTEPSAGEPASSPSPVPAPPAFPPAASSPAPAPVGALLRASSSVSACTLVSRILGMLREMAEASIFGAGWILDAFTLAFLLPNLFRRLFGEGALTGAYVPTLTRVREQRSSEAGEKLAGAVFGVVVIFLAGVAAATIGATYLAPSSLNLKPDSAPGWTPLFLQLLRRTMPYLPLVCGSAILGGTLHVLKRFIPLAVAPIATNLAMLSALGWMIATKMPPEEGVKLLGWALLAGGVMELGIQVISLRAARFRVAPNLQTKTEGVGEVARLMGPSVFAVALLQINLLMDNLFAQFMIPHAGAASALWCANRVMQFPLVLLGVSVAVTSLAYFSDSWARGDRAGLARQITEALRGTFFVSLPASIGLMVLALPIVRGLFERGEFTPENSARTAGALLFYGSAVWCFNCTGVLNRVFLSMQDPSTPMRIAARGVVFNFVFNLLLVRKLEENGLALATAISGVLVLAQTVWALQKRLGPEVFAGLRGTLWKPIAGSVAMGAACWATLAPAADAVARTGWSQGRQNVVLMLAETLLGVAVYGAAVIVMRDPMAPSLKKWLGRP